MRVGIIGFILAFFVSVMNAGLCKNKFFTFSTADLQGGSIAILDVLENISQECGASIVFEDSSSKKAVQKKLSYLNVVDFSLKELLDLVLSSNNLFYKLEDGDKILKISTYRTKTYFIDYVSFSQRKSSTNKVIKTGSSSGGGGGSDSTTMDFTSDFKFWDKIAEEIGYILDRDGDAKKITSKVLINQEAGMLTVTATKRQMDRVDKYIESLMRRLHKEILIEAKIIEVVYTDNATQGVDWTKFELNVNGSSSATRAGVGGVVVDGFRNPNYLIGYDFSMEGMINFLKTQGDVRVVSNPKIMTLNNQPAVINVGEELNYRYQTDATPDENGNITVSYETGSTFVGVTLDVTPQVTDNDYIMLKINPIVSEISDPNKDANGVPYLAPNIKIKQLSSIVKVKNGNKVVIGGLIGKKDTITDTSVPGLSSIPLFGKAFQSSGKELQKGELIIVLIPHIVNGNYNPTLDNLDENSMTIRPYKK